MRCIFLIPFTFKRYLNLVFIGLAILSLGWQTANAKDMEITGHYYVANNDSYTKYTDKIQWKVTNIPEWSKFLVNLKKMPKDLEKDNPMSLKQPEVIHFNVVNSDKKTGHDIFISQAGIQQFSKMPLDSYFDEASEFREFLETELSFNPGYDKVTGEIDINQPGIVVIFRGSSDLKNPYWIVNPSDKKVIERYKYFVKNLKKTSNDSNILSEDLLAIRNDVIDAENNFIIYFNLDDTPFDFLVVASNGEARGTKVASKYYYFQDTAGYFSIFKRQAEDNLKAASRTKDEPEEIRKKTIRTNDLF